MITNVQQTFANMDHSGDITSAFNSVLENVDLVISTCTSIPHLSAAMGKKTWILLAYVPDWRWLLEREDSPWYPTVRLFRQQSMGEWGGVLEGIREELSLI
mgnify:CR=1 FL=1